MKKQHIVSTNTETKTVEVYPLVALYVITLDGQPITAYRRRSFTDLPFKSHPCAFTCRGNAARLVRKLRVLFPTLEFEIRKVEL